MISAALVSLLLLGRGDATIREERLLPTEPSLASVADLGLAGPPHRYRVNGVPLHVQVFWTAERPATIASSFDRWAASSGCVRVSETRAIESLARIAGASLGTIREAIALRVCRNRSEHVLVGAALIQDGSRPTAIVVGHFGAASLLALRNPPVVKKPAIAPVSLARGRCLWTLESDEGGGMDVYRVAGAPAEVLTTVSNEMIARGLRPAPTPSEEPLSAQGERTILFNDANGAKNERFLLRAEPDAGETRLTILRLSLRPRGSR